MIGCSVAVGIAASALAPAVGGGSGRNNSFDNTGAVAKAWGDIKLTPTTFVLNKQGEIVKRYVGAPNFDELHKLIEKLLAEA